MHNLWKNHTPKIVQEARSKCPDVGIGLARAPNSTVKELLGLLEKHLTDKNEVGNISDSLERLKLEFDRNVESRTHATMAEAYHSILRVLKNFQNDKKIVRSALKIMIRLTGFDSDLLTEEGIAYQISTLETEKSVVNQRLIIRWMKHCCIKNERNRQKIFDAMILDEVMNILGRVSPPVSGSYLRDICSLLRALILDDDPEFDYGNSVNRTRKIANDVLGHITALVQRFKYDERVVCDLLQTQVVLLVRVEFYSKFEDAGGIKTIIELMGLFPDNENLNCLVLVLIKIFAQSDRVKGNLVARGAAAAIISTMCRIKTGSVSTLGLACIAALTEKSPSNVDVFYGHKAPCLIIETMKEYPTSLSIQQSGAKAISNMVTKRKADATIFQKLDVEKVLEMATKIHGHEIERDVEAAFSELDSKTDLKFNRMKTQWKI